MENIYREHPSPTGHMRDGRLIPVPEAAAADAVVWFALPPEDGRTVWEALAAQSVAPDQATLRSVPLFAHGLNYGDRVSVAASAEGSLVAQAIVQRGDHVGFRVFLPDEDDSLRAVIRSFGEMGCFVEGYSRRLVGLSCHSAIAQRVADALASAENAGQLFYETAT